jgi:hypothetical protein
VTSRATEPSEERMKLMQATMSPFALNPPLVDGAVGSLLKPVIPEPLSPMSTRPYEIPK